MTAELTLTDEEREGIKKLACERPELLYCILEEVLKIISTNTDELLRRAFLRWQS